MYRLVDARKPFDNSDEHRLKSRRKEQHIIQ